MWNILGPRDARSTEIPNAAAWGSGGLDELARIVRLAPMQLGSPDHVAAALSASLDAAVSRLSDTRKRLLAQCLDLPPSKGRGARWDKAAKRSPPPRPSGMFHARLDSYLQDNGIEPSGDISGEWRTSSSPPP